MNSVCGTHDYYVNKVGTYILDIFKIVLNENFKTYLPVEIDKICVCVTRGTAQAKMEEF